MTNGMDPTPYTSESELMTGTLTYSVMTKRRTSGPWNRFGHSIAPDSSILTSIRHQAFISQLQARGVTFMLRELESPESCRHKMPLGLSGRDVHRKDSRTSKPRP